MHPDTILQLLRLVQSSEGASRSGVRYLPKGKAAALVQLGLVEVAGSAPAFIGETAVRLTDAGREKVKSS